jgi:hypothetical protein
MNKDCKDGSGFQYENPRRLPEAWIRNYLQRKPEQLALDVMRAFDMKCRLERKVDVQRIWIRVLTAGMVAAWGIISWLGPIVLKAGK